MSSPIGVGATNPMIAWNATTNEQGNITTTNQPSLQATNTNGVNAASAALMQDSINESAPVDQTLNTETTEVMANAPVLAPSDGDIRLAYEQAPTTADLYNALSAQYPPPEPTPESTFFNSIDKQLQYGSDSKATKQMDQAASDLNIPFVEVRSQVQFAIDHPNVQVDPKIRAIADSMVKKAEGVSEKQFGLPSDWKPSQEALDKREATVNGLFQGTEYFAFVSGNKEGIPTEQLLFAQANPQLAGQLDPNVVQVANKLSQKSSEFTTVTWGAPTGWRPEPTKKGETDSAVNSRMRSTYTNEFEEGVNKLLKKGTISGKEAAQMRAMFYNHDANIPGKEKLTPLLNDIVGKAQETIQKKFGAPVGFAPAVPEWNYEGIVRGTYADKFISALQDSNLSKADQSYCVDVLFGKSSIGMLSKDLHKTFDKIHEKVASEINNEFGVKFAAVPDIPAAYVASASEGHMVMGKNAIKVAQEFVGAKLSEAGLITSDSPGRVLILDAMKVIGAALDRLSQILTETAIADAENAKKNSAGQMQIQLDKLDKQRIQIQQQIEQFEKAQAMAFLGPLMDILMIIMAIFMGPAALLLAVTFVVVNETVGWEKVFEAIATFLEKALGIPKAITKFILLVLILVVLICSGAGVMLIADMMMQLIMQSKVLQDIAALFGASKEAQEIFAMVVMLVLMVCMIAVSFVFPPAAPEMAAAMSTIALNMVGQIIQAILKVIMEVINVVLKVLGPVGKAIKAAVAVVVKMMKAMMDMLKDLADDLSGIIDDVTTAATKALSKAGGKVTKALGKVRGVEDGAESIATKLEGALEKAKSLVGGADDAAQSGDDALAGLTDVVGAAGKGGAKAAKGAKFLDDPAGFLKDTLKSVQKSIDDLAKEFDDMTGITDVKEAGGLMKSLSKQADDFVAESKDLMKESIESLDKANPLASKSTKAAKEATETSEDALEGTVKAVEKGADAEKIGDDIVKGTEDAVQGAKDTAKKGIDDAEEGIGGARTASTAAKTFAEKDYDNFLDFVVQKMRSLKDDLIKMKDAIKQFLKQIGEDPKFLLDKAKELMSGIADKLGKMKNSIKNFGFEDITQMLDDAEKSVRGTFKSLDDSWGALFKSLKNDPWKWGNAQKAFNQAVDGTTRTMDMMKAIEMFSGIIQMISSLMGVFNNIALADMTRRIGELESEIKMMDATLSIMKTVQEDLQKDIQDVSEHKKQVQEMQQAKWNQLSRIITKLGSASAPAKG